MPVGNSPDDKAFTNAFESKAIGRFLYKWSKLNDLPALFRGNPFHRFSELSRYVELDYFGHAGELVIVVRDPGPGFDVAAVPNPIERDNLFKESGRGVFLINQLMGAVEFTEEGRTVLMRKQRDAMVESDADASRHSSQPIAKAR